MSSKSDKKEKKTKKEKTASDEAAPKKERRPSSAHREKEKEKAPERSHASKSEESDETENPKSTKQKEESSRSSSSSSLQKQKEDSESESTEIPRAISASDDEDEDAEDADTILESKEKEKELEKKKKTVNLKDNKRTRDLQRLKSKKKGVNTIRQEMEEETDENPWFRERECIMLVLQARMMLREMIQIKMKQERIASGDLSVSEIQNLLQSQEEEQSTDWISEIQELKRNLVSEVRRNHVLERELTKLDKRIALLIKNRGNIQEILAHSESKKKDKGKVTETKGDFTSDPRKLEHYQNLFYLLQTEPKYLANLVYLMGAEQMESFLDTVILTLYGDAFSPREEYLILKLFQIAVQKEMSAIRSVSDFLKADSVIPKMVVTYNRRKQGLDFLKAVLAPILKEVMKKEINLELKPMTIYQTMISEQEIKTGEKSTLQRDLTEDQIMELSEVKAIVRSRIEQLCAICQLFFEGIIGNLNKVPYGARWICKQIRTIAQENFENVKEEDILKVTGYFIYYRFINLAIVTPDAFEIVDRELGPVVRKNLISVAKVLQHVFNFSVFNQSDRWMMPLNDWIGSRFDTVRDYFTDLIEVADPEDYLQVDKYMELFQKTKPVIIISLHEIAQTHSFLGQNLDKLAKEKDDPLRVILTDLGEAPAIAAQDDREIQLTLTNRFKNSMEDEISASASLYAETKEMIINTFRLIPVQSSDETDQTLLGILQSGKKFAKQKENSNLATQIDKILENIKQLEADGMVTKADNYSGFLRDIALEVANRAQIREQQRKEIKRLTQTLRNLRKHQKYLNDQIQQYNDYLQDCRLKHYQPKTKKKKKNADKDSNKIGPFKFSYSALEKKGVIIDSEVPSASRKKTKFWISSEAVGVFDIVAKIGGIPVEKMTLELDDLLERNYNNITRLELEQVTLDVNMTIHLLNKFFMKG